MERKSKEEVISEEIFGGVVKSSMQSEEEDSSKQESESKDLILPTQFLPNEKPVEQLILIEIVDCQDCLEEELE